MESFIPTSMLGINNIDYVARRNIEVSEVPLFALIQLLGVIFLVNLSGSLTRSRSTRSHVLLELVLTFNADNYRRWE